MVATLQFSNLLLDSLAPSTQAWLQARLKKVDLPLRARLYDAGEKPRHAHFLTSGIASIVSTMENGATAEVGMLGRESLVESLHLLGNAPVPTHCMMQVEGVAWRMRFDDLKSYFREALDLHDLVLRQVQYQALALSQIAGCNRLHEADERLPRWLLTVHDAVQQDTFRITQEFIADMLGARRTTVAVAAGALQRAGLIEYQRGQMTILNRRKLEAAACECYRVTRDLTLALYARQQQLIQAREGDEVLGPPDPDGLSEI
jgi:CRP-like cAMP-binding protein